MSTSRPEKTTDFRAGVSSTATLLIGLFLTFVALPSDTPSGTFMFAAYGVGAALLIATAQELRGGVRNLIRVDILMLWVLYGLTFFEFLFLQPDVDFQLSSDMATQGIL